MKTFQEYLDAKLEALKKKIVFRGGKRMVLKKTDKKGYKVVGGKEIKMSASQITKDVTSGKYKSFDDPKLPTLQSLKKQDNN